MWAGALAVMWGVPDRFVCPLLRGRWDSIFDTVQQESHFLKDRRLNTMKSMNCRRQLVRNRQYNSLNPELSSILMDTGDIERMSL